MIAGLHRANPWSFFPAVTAALSPHSIAPVLSRNSPLEAAHNTASRMLYKHEQYSYAAYAHLLVFRSFAITVYFPRKGLNRNREIAVILLE